jgi:hypothetical protein
MQSSKSSFYLSLWAQGSRETVTIPCLTLAEAQAIRLKMYAVARPYRSLEGKKKKDRHGKDFIEPALGALHPDIHQQVISTEINISAMEDGSAILTLRPDWMNERLMRISAVTGIPFGPLADAQASLERIQANLDCTAEDYEIPQSVQEEAKRADYLQLKQKAGKSEPIIAPTLDAAGNVIDPNYVSPFDEDYERKLMEDMQKMNEEDPYA